jgi:2-oxoacid:acceptor oxidoreductase gamma subunit (pyruvate/2-ketoisovalerate family)
MADIAVVLDPSLLNVVDIVGSLKKDGLLLVNTTKCADELGIDCNVSTLDAAGIAMRFHLFKEGAPIVNTPMLGMFAKASGLVSLESMEKGLKWKLSGTAATTNIAALRAAFEETATRSIK